MHYDIGKHNTMKQVKSMIVQSNGKWKLMLVIDDLDESEKLLDWLKNFNRQTIYSWIVLFAESDLSDSYIVRLHEYFQIAEKMNAEKIFCLNTKNVSTLLKIAESNNTTHIICPKSIKRRLLIPLLVKNKVKKLKTKNGELDIYSLDWDQSLKSTRSTIFGNN